MLSALVMAGALLRIVECKPCFEGGDYDYCIIAKSAPLAHEHDRREVSDDETVEYEDHTYESLDSTSAQTVTAKQLATVAKKVNTTSKQVLNKAMDVDEIEIQRRIELDDYVDRVDPATQQVPDMLINTDTEITVLQPADLPQSHYSEDT